MRRREMKLLDEFQPLESDSPLSSSSSNKKKTSKKKKSTRTQSEEEDYSPTTAPPNNNDDDNNQRFTNETHNDGDDLVIEHKNTKKNSTKTKTHTSKLNRNNMNSNHNRSFSSSSTGSNHSSSAEPIVSFGYGKHKRTQSSNIVAESPIPGGGYQSSSLYDSSPSTPTTTTTFKSQSNNTKSSHHAPSSSSFDKYQGFGSKDLPKTKSVPALAHSSSRNNEESDDPHIGTMKDNYYEIARKRQNEESGPYILQIIADMLKYIYTAVTETAVAGSTKISSAVSGIGTRRNSDAKAGGEFPQAEIYLEPEKKIILDKFKQYCSKKFDIQNEKHQKLLFALYKACTQKKTTLTEGEHYKFLGFQNTKPETDFRGAGILGLQNLLYFSKHYKKRFKTYFTKCTAKMEVTEDGTFTSYPFVIAGLNVTMMLLSFLGIGFQANKVHNVTAKKNFIELLATEKGKPAIEEDDDDEDEDEGASSSSTPQTTVEGTLLSFDDIPTIQPQQPPKKSLNILTDDISPLVWDNSALPSWDASPNIKSNSSSNPSSSSSQHQAKKPSNANTMNDTSSSSSGKKNPTSLQVSIPSKQKQVAKKVKSKPKKQYEFNLDLFHEMYVVGFTCLHREWYKTKATYFDFNRVLANARKHVEDLLELKFNTYGDVKEFNQSIKH
ncbi:hypothetical protein FDP41_007380 [Naegleria fowleri]|uniref:ELMO domain-containing protein n=1 Tax=Naegleria fowleri TaxID=5763 RepID=A0A6A5C182_NAEFO|nr:uncharacterized protein FDP41_007380 [Naegleria fowleri]KAF0984203.1 hypothetical protein FDP41_007380 [Naegleria fowleri]CAG4709970.1 unnamed protein product [Naegleria fowleri]